MDLEKLLYAFFGWLAGLASPMIVEEFKRKRESRELKKALKIELMELRYRLAAAAYSIQMRFGTLNRELLNWIRPIVRDYTGLNPTHGLLTKIDKISALTDPQIEAVAQSERAPPE